MEQQENALGDSITVSKKEGKNHLQGPVEEHEKKCKQLFDDFANRKNECIKNHLESLHNQFVKDPSDYDAFKLEFAKLLALDNEKLENMIDASIAQVKELAEALALEDEQHENCEKALHKMPKEVTVYQMFFIRILVNNVSTIANIDSGAALTFVNLSFARRANLDHSIDTRYRTTFFGSGGAVKTIGSIHSYPVKIQNAKFDAEIYVLVDEYDFTLGMDFLRRHRAFIDVAKNSLILNDKIHVNFLTEKEVKEWMEKKMCDVDKQKLGLLTEMGLDRNIAEQALKQNSNNIPDAIHVIYYKVKMDQKKKEEDDANDGNFNFTTYCNSIIEVRVCNGNKLSCLRLSVDCLMKHLVALVISDLNNVRHDASAVRLLKNGVDVIGMDRSKTLEMFSGKERLKDSKSLFERMKRPMTKCSIYFDWKPLHDQFIKDPNDYEGFKNEHAAFVAAERRKVMMMNDPTSADGQALVQWKGRLEHCGRTLMNARYVGKPVVMHYAKITVNGVSAVAYIDTGVTRSTISLAFVKKTNLEGKIDTRIRNVSHAFGGYERDIGRICLCNFEIGGLEFELCNIDVARVNDDVLIGMDFLRRHRCAIDVTGKKLVINEKITIDMMSVAEVNEWKSTNQKFYVHHSFKIDEAKLFELVGIGFDKKEVEEALTETSNDISDSVLLLYCQAEKVYQKNLRIKPE